MSEDRGLVAASRIPAPRPVFAGTPRYVPRRLLGVGGMGAVYEVDDLLRGRRVALKVMLASDASRLLRFKQEFRLIADLHHPNLVRLFELEQHEGHWFFTMELVGGEDLRRVLLQEDLVGPATLSDDGGPFGPFEPVEPRPARAVRRAACDPEALVGVLAQILDALEYLHGHGIVHRDLKPSNVMVDLEGVVRVLDFGVASQVDRDLPITLDGGFVGTLAYLAPEQLRGEVASPASDLYALGTILFELLAGEHPFRGPAYAVMAARLAPPPRLDERSEERRVRAPAPGGDPQVRLAGVEGLPHALASSVERLMALDPADRPSIAELRATLGITGAARPRRVRAERRLDTGDVFVGRGRELRRLMEVLARAAAGKLEVAFVSGPSGIGKSAVASMLMRRAAERGFSCLRGRSYEREQVPFVAFDRLVDAMTLALREWPSEHLEPLRPSLAVLEQTFPALGMLTPSRATTLGRPNRDPRELHQEAIAAFTNLVAGYQARAPVLFVLDDLQWADDDSITLLEALLDDGAGRVMVLGLFRSDVPGRPLAGLLGRLGERATVLELGALERTDAVELVEVLTAGGLDGALAEVLATETEGNPFLLRRLAEHLTTLPAADRTARLAGFDAEALLPSLLEGLSAEAEAVLALASTSSRPLDPRLLVEAGGLDRAALDRALGELTAGRFMKTVPPGAEAEPGAPPLVDVYHDVIREAVYGRLGEPRRRELHLRMAEQLEARGGDAEALVHHFAGAGDLTRRRRYALEAAEIAARKLAFVRAGQLLVTALEHPEPGEDLRVTAARWERAGVLFEYGGHHAEAARAFEEALARWDGVSKDTSAEDGVAPRLRLLGLVGANLMATRELGRGRAAFERGLALLGLPLERPTFSRLLVLAGLELRRLVGAWREGQPHLGVPSGGQVPGSSRSASLREPRSDRRGASTAARVQFLDLLVRAFQPLWPLPAAEAALRVLVEARQMADRTLLQRALASGAAVPVILGRCSPGQLDRAHRRLDAAERLAREHGIGLGRELVQLNRSLLWLPTSSTRARQGVEAAVRGIVEHGLGESFDGDVARSFHLLVLFATGDEDAALAASARELVRGARNLINVALAHALRAEVFARRGQLEDARRAVADLTEHLRGAPPSRLDVVREVEAAGLLIAEGRFEEALEVTRGAEALAKRIGCAVLGLDRAHWTRLRLEALIGLLSGCPQGDRKGDRKTDGTRDRRASRLAREGLRTARWLVKRGVLDYPCLGHRAEALLARATGRDHLVDRALDRALWSSSTNTAPYHRWLCLDAAVELGRATLDQESEATALQQAGRYTRPRAAAPGVER